MMTSWIYLAAPLFTQAEIALTQIPAVVLKVAMLLAKGIPIVVRTDVRGSGEYMAVNLMLSNTCLPLLLITSNLPAAQTARSQ